MSAIADAVTAAIETPGTPTVLTGPPGSGKSTAAMVAAELARPRVSQVLRIAPPAGALDAGAAAISSLLRQLGAAVTTRDGWRVALERTGGLLAQGDVMVILDEPSRWTASGGHFAQRADDAIDLLTGPSSTWASLVVDKSHPSSRAFTLPDATPETLVVVDIWGELALAAERVAASGLARLLDTPLKQRLAVALEAWAPGRLDTAATSELAQLLSAAVVGSRYGKRLWALWQRLALARVQIDDDGLETLGAGRLDARGEATLRLALLDGGGRLHDSLRHVALDRAIDPVLGGETLHRAHEQLFELHYQRITNLGDPASSVAIDHAAEALHHAAEIGDTTRTDLVAFDFTDQLNALGAGLIDRHSDHKTAAAVFLRAVQADDRDAYAHHGRARSLDYLGELPDQVAEHYRWALDLNRAVPRWHADLVCFLVDIAQPERARAAWSQAESAISDPRLSSNSYDELHLRVGTHLIARGDLVFAQYVLDGVPAYARDAEHRRLMELALSRAAGEHGSFVPAPRSARAWWREEPQLLTPRDLMGRGLISWAAGRVEAVDSEGVHIHVAQVVSANHDPRRGLVTISPDAWASRCLDVADASAVSAGRFVEIGAYALASGDAQTVVRLLPQTRLRELRHEPLAARRWVQT